MLSLLLQSASRSVRLQHVVERSRPTRRVVDRFVAGESVDDALRTVGTLVDRGLMATVDLLGEDVGEPDAARQTVEDYVLLIQRLGEAGLAGSAEVSLKLTALGQGMRGVSATFARENALLICEAAAAAGTTVTLDMENHTTVDSSLAIARELRADHPWVGTVLQSNLRRTDADLKTLADSSARVRLVKGAYREPVSVAYRSKREVDQAYERQIRMLFHSTGYPMIATHDPNMIEVALDAARDAGRTPDQYEFQMLLGISEAAQRSLAAAGKRVRVYVPYGKDWYRYFMRRLAERPANVAFFLKALAER